MRARRRMMVISPSVESMRGLGKCSAYGKLDEAYYMLQDQRSPETSPKSRGIMRHHRRQRSSDHLLCFGGWGNGVRAFSVILSGFAGCLSLCLLLLFCSQCPRTLATVEVQITPPLISRFLETCRVRKLSRVKLVL